MTIRLQEKWQGERATRRTSRQDGLAGLYIAKIPSGRQASTETPPCARLLARPFMGWTPMGNAKPSLYVRDVAGCVLSCRERRPACRPLLAVSNKDGRTPVDLGSHGDMASSCDPWRADENFLSSALRRET